MIMPRGSDQLLLPANPFFIALTLLAALLRRTCCPWVATRPFARSAGPGAGVLERAPAARVGVGWPSCSGC
jgi:hypothetical protein